MTVDSSPGGGQAGRQAGRGLLGNNEAVSSPGEAGRRQGNVSFNCFEIRVRVSKARRP